MTLEYKHTIDCLAGKAIISPLSKEEITRRELEGFKPSSLKKKTVTKLDLVRTLRRLGMKTNFDNTLANSSEEIKEDWLLASFLRRSDPLIKALNLDHDELFS